MSETRGALVIACEAFADPRLRELRGLADNARALAEVLEDPDIGDFEVRTLVNEPAHAIRARVAEFFAGRRPGDLLLVYYAGYGIRDADGELYLAAADTVRERLDATAVSAEFVNRQIGFGDSGNVVLLLECADPYVVAAVLPRGPTAKGGGGTGIEREFCGRGRTVIAASGDPGYGSEAPAFTGALLKGLATGAADLDGDGRIGLDELYEYVADRVRDLPPGRVPGLGVAGPAEGLYIARPGQPATFDPPRRGLPTKPAESESAAQTDSHEEIKRFLSEAASGSIPPGKRMVFNPRTGKFEMRQGRTDLPEITAEDMRAFDSGVRAREEPARLFWNTRFPRDQGILLNRPHLVVAGAKYLLETGLGPEAEPGAMTSPQQAARLLNREVRYRLEAENGEFRLPDSAEWEMKAESAPMTCTAAGTDQLRVYYRAREAGPAVIRALLIVDGGSVDQQQIELTAVSDGAAAHAVPRVSAVGLPARPVGRSVEDAPSPDYKFSIRRWFADLWHGNVKLADVDLPVELADQLDRVAARLYSELREASQLGQLRGDPGRPLRLADSDEAKLRLAKVAAELHYRLFREPAGPLQGGLPAGMGAIADYLSGQGSEAAPPLLQIVARDYPLPWGLLYDRSSDGGRDLKTAADVDPAGFWGRRFDIYRSVISVDRDTRRGMRRWVKPVIGADVPRTQEQRDFVDALRADLSDALLRVDATSSTVPDLMDWATSGRDSDLVYLFCHARPGRYGGLDAATNWLGLGRTEDEDRVGLEELERWWGKQRETNPIVILNACSSGQQDLIYGAPFVDFFMEKWGAQAFIGTDWPINASFADVFGRRLLGEILQHRRSLRDAFRAVSDEAAAAGNYFPLMYAVYGLNTVQFTEPVSS